MRNKISSSTQESLDFLQNICDEGIVSWPIDYETNNANDRELAQTFGFWFGGDKWSKHGDTFAQFGQDGTGSMFLLWFYPNLTGEPPVVFMGSEGETCIVASNINDFIKQLCSGKLFFDGGWLDPVEEDKDKIDWDNLRMIAEAKFGSLELSPDQLCGRAKNAHPSFVEWVESNVE